MLESKPDASEEVNQIEGLYKKFLENRGRKENYKRFIYNELSPKRVKKMLV